MGLAKLLPTGDAIRVRVEKSRLHIGSSSDRCTWQGAWSKQIELPMNPTLVDYLQLRFEYSEEEIAHSGLAEAVRNAEDYAVRKLQAAQAHLKDFEIDLPQLKDFVDAHLKKKASSAE